MTESLSTYATTLPKEYKKPSATKTLSASPLTIKKYEGLSVEPRSPSSTRELVEYEGGEDGDTEAITKEEEWITKKKTELTTTRQIETRVKRNVVLEDGKVIEDSGPIVSTNTTEDTDKQETETTERKDIGGAVDENDKVPAIHYGGESNDLVESGLGNALASFGGKPITKLVPRPADGLVRETNEKRIVSREEIKERTEVEDVAYLGDFSDEAFVKAVNSGADNLEEVLYSPENQQQLVPLGPRLVHQSIKGRKVVDTEDVQKRCLAQDDGTLVTEQKKTTEHEEFYDQDLPEKDDHSTGSQEQIQTTESSQRYYKQRDEQKVDYVADGKVVGQEMRYAAETEQMERDGPPERPEDWDSLSDRIRKSRLKPKTLLQQQKEAILGDRKDALTKRPLDFDREEETRKGETMKWLESHFGSESTTSSDSRDEDVEPTKKSYFNVTIKSNQNQNGNTSTLSRPSPTKAVVPQEPLPSPITTKPQAQQLSQNGKTKYFQGISNWADRRESTPKQLVTKAFKDELSGTLERNKNLRQVSSSRDDLRYASRATKPADTYVTKEEIMQQKRSHYNNYGSRTDLRHRRQSRDDSGDELKKEDLGYLSGSRTDLRRDRRDSNEEAGARKTHNLKREDSGYVKDSREDVRSSLLREEESNSKISNGKSIIQRDDSAYISSSTNFTEPNQRLPKTSPPRASSPEFQGRPSVPQRRRVIEKKLRQSNSNNYSPPSPVRNADRSEPPPDYSPPPRSSRSRSPPAIIIPPAPAPPMSGTLPSAVRKSNQRTRFASESSSKPTASTQTQTTPSKSGSKVGQAIGNSIRKLVGKIRSASADRKFRMKSKSKSRDRSPSPQHNGYNSNGPNSTTYQQYNVIDSHISGSSSQQQHHQQQQPTSVLKSSKSAPLNRESSIISSSMTNGRGADRRGSSDLDIMANGSANPKQRYYLGEDPYGGSLFGKENKYDKNGKLREQHQYRRREGSSDELTPRETYVRQQPNLSSSNTLGRYQKSYNTSTSNYYNNRLGSTPNLGADYDYRSAQTLPRKLDHSNQNGSSSYFQNRPPQHHSSTINVSIVNQVKPQPLQNTGPAKPARMYSSRPQLNRSKSFNVHGLNGTNDPNPIFIGKSRNNYNRSDAMYKSNPALYHSSSQQDSFANGLKSPSIVNLISRSQKDLTRIGEDDPPVDFRKEKRMSHSRPTDKKDLFLKGLQDQAPELYRTIHGGSASPIVNGRHYKHPSSSLGSRSPIEINKDTASIIRRGSSSTETDYTETYKYTTKNDDPKRPTVTNTVQSFTKKTVPTKDGRGMETIHSQEKRSVTTSRFKNEPISNLKYYDDRRRRSGSSSNLGGGNTTVIEVRRK